MGEVLVGYHDMLQEIKADVEEIKEAMIGTYEKQGLVSQVRSLRLWNKIQIWALSIVVGAMLTGWVNTTFFTKTKVVNYETKKIHRSNHTPSLPNQYLFSERYR